MRRNKKAIAQRIRVHGPTGFTALRKGIAIAKSWRYLFGVPLSVRQFPFLEVRPSADFDAAGSDLLKDNKVETNNFAGIVDKFEQARGTNSTFSNWAMTNARMDFHLSGEDTTELGGDLVYQYSKNGNLNNLSVNPAQGILGSTQFGSTAQTLQPTASLQDSSPQLS